MSESLNRVSRVAELESRQDEALRELDELERRIDAALREFQPTPTIPLATPIFDLPEVTMPLATL